LDESQPPRPPVPYAPTDRESRSKREPKPWARKRVRRPSTDGIGALLQKLADLQVLERLYSDRHDGAEEVHVDSTESTPEQRWEESSAS
jgi:hypothetical protein